MVKKLKKIGLTVLLFYVPVLAVAFPNGEMEAFRQYGDTWRHAVIAATYAWAGLE